MSIHVYLEDTGQLMGSFECDHFPNAGDIVAIGGDKYIVKQRVFSIHKFDNRLPANHARCLITVEPVDK